MEDISLPYRSNVDRAMFKEDKPSTRDEGDFSTLKLVRDQIESYLYDLKHDFMVLDVGAQDPDVVDRSLQVQIKARQEIVTLLSPLVQALNSSIANVGLINID